MKRAVVLSALVAVVLLAIPTGDPPAAAQTGDGPTTAVGDDPPLELTLVEVDAVLPAADPEATVGAVLELYAGDVAREDLRLVTTVYSRVDTRAQLRAATEGQLPAVFSAESSDLPDLAPGTTRVVRTATARASLALGEDDRAGVYPLQFQVFDSGDPVGAVLTSLVVLPAEGPVPLPATTVLRVPGSDAAPAAGDAAPASLEAAVAPDAPLVAFADEIDRVAGDGSAAGITLVADGRLLGDLAALADGFTASDGALVAAGDRAPRRAADVLAQVRRLAGRGDTDVLAYPHGPADLVALVRGGLVQQAVDLVGIGADRTASVLGTDVRGEVLVPPDGLDADTLAALGATQPSAVLLDQRYLALADEDAMEPVRRLRTADGGEVRLLVPDAGLSQALADPRQLGVAGAVQELLAQTAIQWFASAEDGAATAALVALDVTTTLPDGLVASATAAIETAPWLRPVALEGITDQVDPSDRLVRLAYPPRSAASELDAGYVARLGEAHAALAPLAALLPEDDPTPRGLAESLVGAGSLAYRQPEDRPAGTTLATQVVDTLAALGGAVQILPSAPITLTSTTGEVPVTLVNTGDVPVRVRVALSSTRFAFADGDSRDLTLEPLSSQQLGFAARSLNPGGFAAITVTVSDTGAGSTLAQTRISVRSTAFPVVGLIAVLGSGIVLVVWGLRQSLRRRRPGRHEAPRRDRDAADRPAGVA